MKDLSQFQNISDGILSCNIIEYIAYAGIDFYFNIFLKFNIDSFGVSSFVANQFLSSNTSLIMNHKNSV